jgi:hypothetical protein
LGQKDSNINESDRYPAAHNGLVAGLEAGKYKPRQGSADQKVSVMELPHQIRPGLAQIAPKIPAEE